MKPEEIEKRAKEIADISHLVTGYASKLWYRMIADTKLHLAKGKLKSKPAWMVMNMNQEGKSKDYVVCSGSFEKCVDYIVDQWVMIRADRLIDAGKNRTGETVKAIIRDIEFEQRGNITYERKNGLGWAREIIEKNTGIYLENGRFKFRKFKKPSPESGKIGKNRTTFHPFDKPLAKSKLKPRKNGKAKRVPKKGKG